MPDDYAGFIDVGYLRSEGAKALGYKGSNTRPNASGVVAWLKSLAMTELSSATFLRTYWYDGSFDPAHSRYSGQRKFFDSIAATPGVQLRLGHVAEHEPRYGRPIRKALERTATGLGLSPSALLGEFDKHWEFRPERQQKGVDTLIAPDLVRLAGRNVCTTAVLFAGDRDLAEAVRAAQDFGIKVLVATPNPSSVAREVRQLADDVLIVQRDQLRPMLSLKPSSS